MQSCFLHPYPLCCPTDTTPEKQKGAAFGPRPLLSHVGGHRVPAAPQNDTSGKAFARQGRAYFCVAHKISASPRPRPAVNKQGVFPVHHAKDFPRWQLPDVGFRHGFTGSRREIPEGFVILHGEHQPQPGGRHPAANARAWITPLYVFQMLPDAPQLHPIARRERQGAFDFFKIAELGDFIQHKAGCERHFRI